MARKDPGKPHEYEGLFLIVEFFWTFAGLAVCYEGGNRFNSLGRQERTL